MLDKKEMRSRKMGSPENGMRGKEQGKVGDLSGGWVGVNYEL